MSPVSKDTERKFEIETGLVQSREETSHRITALDAKTASTSTSFSSSDELDPDINKDLKYEYESCWESLPPGNKEFETEHETDESSWQFPQRPPDKMNAKMPTEDSKLLQTSRMPSANFTILPGDQIKRSEAQEPYGTLERPAGENGMIQLPLVKWKENIETHKLVPSQGEAPFVEHNKDVNGEELPAAYIDSNHDIPRKILGENIYLNNLTGVRREKWHLCLLSSLGFAACYV